MSKRYLLFLILFLTFQTLFSQVLTIQWQSCFGGSEPDFADDILEVEDGFLILGNARSDDGDVSFLHGGQDGWIIKIDTIGNILWEKTYGGSYADGFKRIFSAADGSFYVLSSSNSSNGDISYDPYLNSTDFWIVKIDSLGNIIWEKIVGGEIIDQMWTGTATNDGGIVGFGWTGSTSGDVSENYGFYDMWMIKLNSDGDVEWDFSLGTSSLDAGQALIQTSDGGFLVGGTSMIGEGGNIICEPHSPKGEAILVKLDSSRNIEWQNCYGGSENEGVTGLLEFDNGYIFVAYTDSDDGDVSGFHGTVGENTDIWVVCVDFYGNIIWQRCLGGTLYEFSDILFNTEDNGFVIIGYAESHNGDVIGNHTQSEYDSDIWFVKLSSEGDILWQQCVGGIGHEQLNFGVLKKSDVNYILAGQFDQGPSFDVECTPFGFYADMPDVWVLEVKDTTSTVGINWAVDNKLAVYPNPAKDYVEFVFKDVDDVFEFDQEIKEIQIYNLYSEEVANLLTDQNRIVWDSKYVKSGIYYYTIKISRTIYKGKIIISK